MNDHGPEIANNATCHGDITLALRVVTGDLPPTTDALFGDPAATRPDWIDRRVLLQTRLWIDRTTTHHLVAEMSPEYRSNVLGFLRDQAPAWIHQAWSWEILAALHGLIEGLDARDHLELLDQLTGDWTDHTPLGHELHRLNHTEPPPFTAAPTLHASDQTDTPQILRDEDDGLWQITTESTSSYLLDLDRRQIMRRPGNRIAPSPAASSGERSRPPVNLLDFDGEWTQLDHILRCQLGDVLVVLDQRPGAPAGGYRVSTPIALIERCADWRASSNRVEPATPNPRPPRTPQIGGDQ